MFKGDEDVAASTPADSQKRRAFVLASMVVVLENVKKRWATRYHHGEHCSDMRLTPSCHDAIALVLLEGTGDGTQPATWLEMKKALTALQQQIHECDKEHEDFGDERADRAQNSSS